MAKKPKKAKPDDVLKDIELVDEGQEPQAGAVHSSRGTKEERVGEAIVTSR